MNQDIYSYNVEVLRGLGLFNLVTIIMHEKDIGPKAAVEWIGERNEQIVGEFLAFQKELAGIAARQWGDDTRRQVGLYVDILGCWVRANENWHFESHRHFGTEGAKMQKERQVAMLPRVDASQARVDLVSGLPDSDVILDTMDRTGVAGMQILTKTS